MDDAQTPRRRQVSSRENPGTARVLEEQVSLLSTKSSKPADRQVFPPQRPSVTDSVSFRETAKFVAPYVIPRSWDHKKLALASTVSTILYKSSLFLPGMSSKIVIDAVSSKDMDRAQKTFLAMFGVSLYFIGRVGAAVFSSLQEITFERLTVDISRRFGTITYEHLMMLDMSYHNDISSGKSIELLNRGISAVTIILKVVILQLGPTLAEAMVTSVIFVRLGTMPVACTTFFSCMVYIYFTKMITKWRAGYQREITKAQSAISSKAVETFTSFETVKMFSTERREVQNYNKLRHDLQEASVKTKWMLCLFYFGQSTITGFALVIGMILTVHDVVYDDLTAGDFTLIFAYMGILYGPLAWVGSNWGEVVAALTDLEDVQKLLSIKPQVGDSPDAKELIVDPLAIQQKCFGELVFSDVSFHYDGGAGGIYNVSFHVRPGHVVALCGATGSGKSTIGRLLMRFYEPDEGRILLDGVAITRYTQESLRSSIGVVPQETVLFDETIRDNISYGQPGITDEEIWRALEASEMAEYVRKQPLGLDTVTGAGGIKVSGGERQRIGASRCICKNPGVVLLDESTSALDTAAEKTLQESFVKLFRGRTTVMIAHRLSTIMHADEIIVLEPCLDSNESSVVERGSHKDLCSAGGKYAQMWASQTK